MTAHVPSKTPSAFRIQGKDVGRISIPIDYDNEWQENQEENDFDIGRDI
jgi:hypothetical protein